MAKLAKTTEVLEHTISKCKAVTCWGELQNTWENTVRKIFAEFYCTCYWSKSLFQPAVPTSSKHHFSTKIGRACRLTLPTLMPAWGVGGVFRELHIKLYLSTSPLAQAVGKTYCYFSSEITSFKNVSSVCLQKARSHSTWSSKQFGWPCQLSNIQSNKKKYDWQNSHNKNKQTKNLHR